ncbi:MAG TPA: serine/threonine-protein kinase [Burkholderiales bacterium]|nr:serine/threonine-protein kinase [Burkholderiales bacterium]
MAAVMPETLGRYKVLEVIGRGAMGVVYKAVDPAIDRVVAIKTINLSLNPEELSEYEARFQQEIKAAGRFSHPNIVTVYDVGRTDELAYMAMEFLNGRELKDLLAGGQRLEVATAVELLAQVADGLAFAHEHGIVHRDVKPSNIMVIELPNGVLAKITDFGIARMPGSAVKTMTGIVLGSPRYMSPEQVVGRPLDARSDVFSLGVVLYETLTGVAPFDGENLTAIMHATANVQPEPPSARNAAVPRMLDLIVAKALAKSLDDRYPSMRELALDLREIGRQAPRGSGPVVLPPRPAAAEAATISGRYQQDPAGEDAAVPLKLATQFDSFGATVRLAALTQQTVEFRGYISQTQKMRAYQGQVDERAAPPAPDPAASTGPARAVPAIPRGGGGYPGARDGQSWAIGPLVVLGVLALAVIGLTVLNLVR